MAMKGYGRPKMVEARNAVGRSRKVSEMPTLVVASEVKAGGVSVPEA